MTTEQLDQMAAELNKKGLYVLNESALKAVKGLRKKYDVPTSLEEVREITYKVWKKHKVTLSEEIAYVRVA
jgi:uncharacterized protein YfkK (UPF0435 family)